MKQLDYFTIDGEFGGNQDWFANVVMHIGGCAAAAACDSCIYFARYRGLGQLYPFDINALSREDYKRFSQIMKPYIRPRAGGVKKLSWYREGLDKYIRDAGRESGHDIHIKMEEFSGERSFQEARQAVVLQIDAGYPVPYLMLRHKDQKFKDFIWHWFLLAGYEEQTDDIVVRAATYGAATDVSLKELWNTGCEEKGGMILYSI